MNEWYAKDTSKKIKAIFKSRMMDGKRCSGSIPYENKRLLSDKQALHIDDEAAVVVRRIFEMAAGGSIITQIADALSEDKVLIPTAYQEKSADVHAHCHTYHDPYRWSNGTVSTILDRQEYLGHNMEKLKADAETDPLAAEKLAKHREYNRQYCAEYQRQKQADSATV